MTRRRAGGGEVRSVKAQLRGALPIAAMAVTVLAVIALALLAAPAIAFTAWQHDDAATCDVCHSQGTPTDAACTACHTGFQSFPGLTCWSCHVPGSDVSALSTPSSACSQACHLWNATQKQYLIPASHGTNPHLGATVACLDCHSTSVSIVDRGQSPHHSGTATGFTTCGVCHDKPRKHAGRVACTKCHKKATAFHLFQVSTPGFRKCGFCHAKRHAGVKVQTSKCATCHKGTDGRKAQHSKKITRKRVCGICHRQKLHASAVSRAVRSCRACHRGKFHARQRTPARSVCTACHGSALAHANGFQCILCHRRAVHTTRPRA